MKIVHELPNRAYINVMELLVAEEVEKQIHGLPPRVLKYMKRLEVETYALNRLPSLYASSERGWQHQYERAKRELRNQIKSAVRQAIAAVQVDPLRLSEPLKVNNHEDAQVALQAFREMLQQPELSWEGVVTRLKVLLTKKRNAAAQAQPAPAPAPEANPEASHRTRQRANNGNNDQHSIHWRPGTYGAEVSWQAKHPQPGSDFDWNDHRYLK